MIEALKTIEDWDVAQQLEGWDDQEVKQTYDQVVDLLTPEDIESEKEHWNGEIRVGEGSCVSVNNANAVYC